ncbi:hypothetical protein BGZ61DRAFT_403732 [Ilyonectria robusta]|uniref:uncharacterized protein n=1 Tax=Ilyonectria robusta TaxID=1079257 RepID=UPI001E8E6A30|nr:uncharacterized protein BGZ61DRAFT_403732 [Ilyonectria robusta]KAH8659637.1 hypothetical protein BGZ61DRAFT_403732 [Ilyonectria robusta]
MGEFHEVAVEDTIFSHPKNSVQSTNHQSAGDKAWANNYLPITKFTLHSSTPDVHVMDTINSTFGRLLGDDIVRAGQGSANPTHRRWLLNSTEDAVNFFSAEVSDPVLNGFNKYPEIVSTYRQGPLSTDEDDDTVDVHYSMLVGDERVPVLIGKFQDCLIMPEQWERGRLTGSQKSLSRELRGYADMYACPHVFCFDGERLLLLQFRARTKAEINDSDCDVDCWIIPRDGPFTPDAIDDECGLRYGLYRFLVQGFRRCQGLAALDVVLNGCRPAIREWYNGRPLWDIGGGKYDASPWGYHRKLDGYSGAWYWTGDDKKSNMLCENNLVAWDTPKFW